MAERWDDVADGLHSRIDELEHQLRQVRRSQAGLSAWVFVALLVGALGLALGVALAL